METFIDRIEEVARKKHWRFPQLEAESGVSAGTMRGWKSRLKSGATVDPEASRILRIARALGTTVEYLMTGEETNPPPKEYDDPLKKKLCDFVDELDHEALIRLQGWIDVLRVFTLQPQIIQLKDSEEGGKTARL